MSLLIPLYLVDNLGNGVASLTINGSDIQVVTDGQPPVNGAGTVAEVGGFGNGAGAYVYTSPDSEANGGTNQLAVLVLDNAASTRFYSFATLVPPPFDVGPIQDQRNRTYVTLVDNVGGNRVTGKSVPALGEVQVSVNGGAWTNKTGTWSEVGGGLYYYACSDAELGVGSPSSSPRLIMIKVTIAGTLKRVAWIYCGGGTATTVTPEGEISADPDIARWTPLTATVRATYGHAPIVVAKIGIWWWTVYDGTIQPEESDSEQFAPFFREHSSQVLNADGSRTITLLPNGGWWRSPIELKYLDGSEVAAI